MDETERQAYRRDAQVLGEIGKYFAQAALPKLEIRLSRHLAEQAVAAWEREDNESPVGGETCEQRVERQRAGTLALIGLSITDRGRWEGDDVVVELDPVFVGLAIDAADDLATM
jgi:hypothetical protein